MAQIIRKSHGPSEPIVAALTGYGHADDRARTTRAGFQAHFTRPVELETLKEFLAMYQETGGGARVVH